MVHVRSSGGHIGAGRQRSRVPFVRSPSEAQKASEGTASWPAVPGVHVVSPLSVLRSSSNAIKHISKARRGFASDGLGGPGQSAGLGVLPPLSDPVLPDVSLSKATLRPSGNRASHHDVLPQRRRKSGPVPSVRYPPKRNYLMNVERARRLVGDYIRVKAEVREERLSRMHQCVAAFSEVRRAVGSTIIERPLSERLVALTGLSLITQSSKNACGKNVRRLQYLHAAPKRTR